MAWAVRFEGVSKRYRDGGPRYSSLRHDLAMAFKRMGGLFSWNWSDSPGRLALEDVSFEVQQGESFAIVGPNGAGKTTALRIISRITYPSVGRVRVRGRVGALIEVGSGVHPELTARENIWLYGQILGMSRGDIRRRFDSILDFAELGGVADIPAKKYSSGMQLRLGFAIASHLEPDVFVVDEALAVGDAGFQSKCVERMSRLVADGKTLIFVSHNLSAVEATCRKGLFLLGGRVCANGDTRAVLRTYLGWVDDTRQTRAGDGLRRQDARGLRLVSVTCHGRDGAERYAFHTGDDVEVRLRFLTAAALDQPQVSIGISDGRPGDLILCSTLVDGGAPEIMTGATSVSCYLHSLPLLPRVYQVWCSVRSARGFGDLFDWQQVGAFRISARSQDVGFAAQGLQSAGGPVLVQHEWKVIADP